MNDDDKPTVARDAAPAMTMRGPHRDLDAGSEAPETQVMPVGVLEAGVLGRFKILDTLGAGGMGVVLAAYDPQLDRKVAIKVLRTRGLTAERREKEAARMLREAKAMAQLAHPHVVTVYEAGTIEDRVFIAMEYIAGKTLRQWLHEKPRSVDEILAAYLKAGRGLAAGHAAGLVHRDFKPDNVLVGDDGRVCVIDFGLARPSGEAAEEGERPSSAPQLAAELTTVGGVSGTPIYMAPEQHHHGQIDARADQFAFCVSLFEALYGRLPYEGKDYVELVANLALSTIRMPAQNPAIPGRVTGAVLRGLKTKREERFASMTELLDALAPPPKRRSRAAYAAAAAAVAATGITLAAVKLTARDDPADLCADAPERLAGVWDAAVKERARTAFIASGRSYAPMTFERVERELDRYAADWQTRRRQICEATRVRHERSQLAYDLGTHCLDDRLAELGTMAKLFGEPDKAIVDKAVLAVGMLSPLGTCEAIVPGALPPDVHRVAIDQVRHELAEVRAYHAAAKYAGAIDKAQKLIARAKPLGYPALDAELEITLAKTLSLTGKPAEAEPLLREAIRNTARAKDDRMLAQAWSLLLWVVGYQLARYDEAIALQPVVEAAIERSDGDDFMKAELAFNLASTHLQKGEYDRALKAYESALVLRTKAVGEISTEVAQVENALGAALFRKADLDGASKHFKKAIEIFEKTLGPNHPDIGRPLSNLGGVAQMQGKLDDAANYFERATKIFEEVLPEDPSLGLIYNNLGGIERDRKDCAKAIKHYTRSLAILEKLGPTHPYVSYPLIGRAQCLVDSGKPTDAIADGERAVSILATQDPAQLAEAKYALARALWDAGKERARARTLANEAKQALVKVGAAGAAQLAQVDAWLKKH